MYQEELQRQKELGKICYRCGRYVKSRMDKHMKQNNCIHHHHIKGKWTVEEDAIILREREIKISGYATRASKFLEGRNRSAVIHRWHRIKNHCSHVNKYGEWTAEEDAIILHERQKKIIGYPARAAKSLEGRTENAVKNRWSCYLKKQIPTRYHKEWTAEEDAIILRERQKKNLGYSVRAAKNLEGRTENAVRCRWNKLDLK